MSKKFISLIDEKLAEQKADIAALKVSDAKSKATQLHAKRREYNSLQLVKELLSANPDVTLSEDAQKTLVSLTTLKTERAVYEKIVVKAGDNLLELVQRYDRKDVVAKIRKAAAEANLVIDEKTGFVTEKE